MDSALKRSCYSGMRRLGLYDMARWQHRRSAVILTYHGVLSGGDDHYANRNCVTAAQFEQQMAFVARSYHVLPLQDLIDRLIVREPLPEYALAITFDDGFRNNCTVATPILSKYDLPATVFLTTAFINSPQLGLWTERVDWLLQSSSSPKVEFNLGEELRCLSLASTRERIIASDVVRGHLKRLSPQHREQAIAELAEKIGGEQDIDTTLQERYAFLTWDQIRAMERQHISFGSHTHTHAIMSTLSPAEADFEIRESKRLIENELQKPCTLFSYPNGSVRDFSRRDYELLIKHGFTGGVSQLSGFNTHRTNRFALRRVNITRNNDFNYFLAKVTGVWAITKKFFGSA